MSTWNDLQLQAEQAEYLGATGKLARLEEALDILYIDLHNGELNDDFRDVYYNLSKLIAKVEKIVQSEEKVGLEKWINGNCAHDWDSYQPRAAGDSIFYSRKRNR